MGVYVHSLSFLLDKQFLKVFQVMAAYEDSRTVANSDLYFSDFGVSVACRVGLVKKSHRLYAAVAYAEYEREQRISVYVGSAHFGQCIFNDRVDVLILIAEVEGVACVCSHSFAVGELLESTDVLVCF